MERLKRLLDQASPDCDPWLIGKIPKHYKRITVDKKTAMELAILGASEMGGCFDVRLYFSQALISGAIISGRYKTVVICCPSQYGKSYLMGHVGLYQAFKGHPQYLAAAKGDTTNIIMGHVIRSLKDSDPEIQDAFMQKGERLEKLAQQLSKKRIAARTGGFVECVTLGDTFTDKTKNDAIGRGGDYIVDEAALVSNDAFAETGRAELAGLGENNYMTVMISNPHNPGYFYDCLTGETDDKTFIIWMDACTVLEEGRWTKEQILKSKYAQEKSTRIRYWLCELEQFGSSMFTDPVVSDEPLKQTEHYLGVDAAYKGKDSICLAHVSLGEKVKVEEIVSLKKTDWIDGVTSEDIIKEVSSVVGTLRCPLTCVDVGFGVWLVEGLAKRGVSVKGINFASGATKERIDTKQYAATNAANVRAEMHLDLQDLMENKAIVWSTEAYDKVKDIFPYVSCERKTSGKIQIKPKPAIKAELGRSPDELDSVLLAIHAAILCAGENREFITND